MCARTACTCTTRTLSRPSHVRARAQAAACAELAASGACAALLRHALVPSRPRHAALLLALLVNVDALKPLGEVHR